MTIHVLSLSWTTERTFKSVGILHLELLPNHNSSSGFFGLVGPE
jgi:hypothetical protein